MRLMLKSSGIFVFPDFLYLLMKREIKRFMITITKPQARQLILAKQGLIGTYRFVGKSGAYDYVRQAGCIQYDPVDVCGKNAELTLKSRIVRNTFFM